MEALSRDAVAGPLREMGGVVDDIRAFCVLETLSVFTSPRGCVGGGSPTSPRVFRWLPPPTCCWLVLRAAAALQAAWRLLLARRLCSS